MPNSRQPRAPLSRTHSAAERAPLAAVPSIELSEDGEPTLMGRSSNSSHYQLSTNKLISRVHVRAKYIAPVNPGDEKQIQIECTGWNGIVVHCQSRKWELQKGDTFTSGAEGADVMLDVQDARVLITWPQIGAGKALTPSDSDWSFKDGEMSPTRRPANASGGSVGGGRVGQSAYSTSPLRQQHRLQSPVSPSPAAQGSVTVGPGGSTTVHVPVKVYEDEPSDEEKEREDAMQTQQTQISTQLAHSQSFAAKTSFLNDPFVADEALTRPGHDLSDNDEENDPIIMSFGPFGANLDARFGSFQTSSPKVPSGTPPRRPLQQLKEESVSPQRPAGASPLAKRRRISHHHEILQRSLSHDPAGDLTQSILADKAEEHASIQALKNYVINQLAYSALSATPLSAIFDSVPAYLRFVPHSVHNTQASAVTLDDEGEADTEAQKAKTEPSLESSAAPLNSTSAPDRPLTLALLEQILTQTSCVGAVERLGKDAAGKRLESEFYYILERDNDEKRREVVMGMGGRSLRNCRKSHKVSHIHHLIFRKCHRGFMR